MKKIIKFFLWGIGSFAGLMLLGFIAFLIFTSSSADKSVKKITNAPIIEKKEQVIEVRICPKYGINIKTGPGTNYKKVEIGRIVKGQKLYVLEEKNGWIHFRVTPKDVGWSGWVRKDLTLSIDEWNLSIKRENLKTWEENIKLLKENGLLVKINPQMNEAFVNSLIWYGIDYQTKENIARTMADYCEAIGDVAWIEIKDYRSGKKLAKYSSWGFKTY